MDYTEEIPDFIKQGFESGGQGHQRVSKISTTRVPDIEFNNWSDPIYACYCQDQKPLVSETVRQRCPTLPKWANNYIVHTFWKPSHHICGLMFVP